MNFWKEWIEANFALVAGIVIVTVGLVGAAFIVDRVFFEPGRQNAYQFEVSQSVGDICMAPNREDSFTKGRIADLKALIGGKPERWQQLPADLRYQAEAVVDRDFVAGCGDSQ